MKVVADRAVREYVEGRGGAVYLRSRRRGCCRATFVLEATTDRPEHEVELVRAVEGVRVFATPGLLEPDELHLALSKRGELRAFWNGQSWIG